MFRRSCSHPWLFYQTTSLPRRVRKSCEFRCEKIVVFVYVNLVAKNDNLLHRLHFATYSGTDPSWWMITNRWVVRKGSVSATAATSCATPPPPSSPPSPPSPQSSHPSSSSSPFPSPSPPLLPSYPSTSLWPIFRQIWLLLPQGVNSARELYHNYFAFRTRTHVTVGVSHRNKRFSAVFQIVLIFSFLNFLLFL